MMNMFQYKLQHVFSTRFCTENFALKTLDSDARGQPLGPTEDASAPRDCRRASSRTGDR